MGRTNLNAFNQGKLFDRDTIAEQAVPLNPQDEISEL